MSTFTAFLDQISTTQAAAVPFTLRSEPHVNPHATPTRASMEALFRHVQDQFRTLANTSESPQNVELLNRLFQALQGDIYNPPKEVQGVSQEFLQGLDRVPRKNLGGGDGGDDACPICTERYLDDKHCLVVELPCHKSHRFDLECVGPWLLAKGCCPLCRKDFVKKKEKAVEVDGDGDGEDYDAMGMYS